MSALAATLLLLGLAGQDAKLESSEPVTTVHAQSIGRVDIPDELIPALVPYMHCLAASQGIPVRDHGRVVPPPAGITRGGDCGPARREAALLGDRLLQRQGIRNQDERRRRVEAALANADNFAAMSANPPPPSPPAEEKVESER